MALELESLIIKLLGDGSDYLRMLREAQRHTQQFVKDINTSFSSRAGGSVGGNITKGVRDALKAAGIEAKNNPIKPKMDMSDVDSALKKIRKKMAEFRQPPSAIPFKPPTATQIPTAKVAPGNMGIPFPKPPRGVPQPTPPTAMEIPPGVKHIIGRRLSPNEIAMRELKASKEAEVAQADMERRKKAVGAAISGLGGGMLSQKQTKEEAQEADRHRKAMSKADRMWEKRERQLENQRHKQKLKDKQKAERQLLNEQQRALKEANREADRAAKKAVAVRIREEKQILKQKQKEERELARLQRVESNYHARQSDKERAKRERETASGELAAKRLSVRMRKREFEAEAKEEQRSARGKLKAIESGMNQLRAKRQKDREQGENAAKRIGAAQRKKEAKKELEEHNNLARDLASALNKRFRESNSAREKANKDRQKLEQQQAQAAINYDYRLQRRAERQEQRAVQAAINHDYRERQKAQKRRIQLEKDAARHRAQETRFNRERRRERTDAMLAGASRGAGIAAVGAGGLGAIIGGTSVAAIKTSIDAFAAFDQEMTKSTSIMGDLSEETRKTMESVAIDLSTKGVQSADQLAQAYFFLASAGYSANDAIKLLPTVQAFATAGAFDLAKATSLAADSQAALGLKTKDAVQNMRNLTRITDVLSKADSIANATIEQFATSLSRQAGAALKSYHKDVEEGVAVLAALADQGIKAEYAGTQLSILLRYLGKTAVKEAEAHKAYGLAVFDSNGAMRNMGDIIENLEQIIGPMNDEMRAATLLQLGFEARMQQAILPLIGTSQRIKEYEKELREANGMTKEIADKQMQSFSNQLKLLKNEIMAVAISIGKELAPVILMLALGLKSVVQFIAQMNPGLLASAIIMGVVTGAILGMVAATLGLTVAILAAGAALNTMFGGIGILIGAGVTFVATMWSIYAVVGGAGVTGAILVLIQAMGGFKKVAKDVQKWGMDMWEWTAPARKAIVGLFNTIAIMTGALIGEIKTLVGHYLNGIKMMVGTTLDWNKALDMTVEAIYGLEFALLNTERVGKLMWAVLMRGAIGYGNEVMHWFKEVIPSVVIQTALYVMRQVKIVVDNTVKSVENGIANMSVILANLDALLNKRVRLSDLILTPIGQGMKDFEKFGALIPSRVIGANEQKWINEIEDLSKKLGADFVNFVATKSRMKDVLAPVVDEAKDSGKEAGDLFAKGFEKGIGRFDAALFGSAEALTRIQEYTEGVLGRKGQHKGIQVPQKLGQKVNVMGDMEERMRRGVPPEANQLERPSPRVELAQGDPDDIRANQEAIAMQLIRVFLARIADNTDGFNGVRIKTGVF